MICFLFRCRGSWTFLSFSFQELWLEHYSLVSFMHSSGTFFRTPHTSEETEKLVSCAHFRHIALRCLHSNYNVSNGVA